jgi:hypothetical protein
VHVHLKRLDPGSLVRRANAVNAGIVGNGAPANGRKGDGAIRGALPRMRGRLGPEQRSAPYVPGVLQGFRNRLADLGRFRLTADVSRARAADQNSFDRFQNRGCRILFPQVF